MCKSIKIILNLHKPMMCSPLFAKNKHSFNFRARMYYYDLNLWKTNEDHKAMYLRN